MPCTFEDVYQQPLPPSTRCQQLLPPAVVLKIPPGIAKCLLWRNKGLGEEIIQLRTTGLIHHFLLDDSKNGLIKQMIGRRRKGGLWETYKGIGILTESLRIRWISVVEGWLACQNVGEEIPVKETTRTNESKVIYVKQFSVISGQGMYGKGTGCKVGGR